MVITRVVVTPTKEAEQVDQVILTKGEEEEEGILTKGEGVEVDSQGEINLVQERSSSKFCTKKLFKKWSISQPKSLFSFKYLAILFILNLKKF